MNKLPFMPLYVSDYLADTTHLTCEEHGAYLLLLMALWKSGGVLPHEDTKLARIVRLSAARWGKVWPNIAPFFYIDGDVIRHKRVEKEMANAKEVSAARSKAGKIGAEAKRLKSLELAPANAVAGLEQSVSTGEPSHSSHITDISSGSEAVVVPSVVQPVSPEPKEGSAALCVSLGKRITDLMGVTNDPRWFGNWSVVQVWLSQGYDPELDIWPAVAARVERIKKTNGKMPGGLKYFSNIIADHHQARIAGMPLRGSTQSPAQDFTLVTKGTPQYAAWIEHQRRQGKPTKFLESRDTLSVPVVEISKIMGGSAQEAELMASLKTNASKAA